MRIGLVTEGPTDLYVIDNMLTGFFDDIDIFVVDLFPDRSDETMLGGWERVFQYCGSELFRNSFRRLDYVIVQVDTDVCELPNFGVAKLENGVELSPRELIERVKTKLISVIGEEFFNEYKESIGFAICVYSLECWLLPIHCTGNHRNKITGCLETLNRFLAKGNKRTIGVSKDREQYNELSKIYRSNKKLISLCKLNPSLEVFIEELSLRFSQSDLD